MLKRVLLLGLAAHSVCAAPTLGRDIGLKFEKRGDGLPLLRLPYGTWRAAKYDPNGDLYTFKNIRYGAPPVGDLRWAAPATPENNDTISDGSYGPICYQTAVRSLNLVGPGAAFPIGAAANQFLGGIPLPFFTGGDEDCLFLDINVPGKAVRDPSQRLPVIVWFFGGAYVFGSKDGLDPLPFYDGTGIVRQAEGEVIFVSFNYRVGAFGFLSGTSMEDGALPNAGLHDQRAVLQWVQDYIGLLGGDKAQVSAWGESAGASSIVHHLVQKGGTQDPLFSRAVLQSPAYAVLFDRKGTLENSFQTFAKLAGCEGQGIKCMRAARAGKLSTANDQLNKDAPDGWFAVGPAPDGDFIRQLPVLELASGNYWKGLESIIISHAADESELFVDGTIVSDEQFTKYLGVVFPNFTQAAGLNDVIEKTYPPPGPGKKYRSQQERVKALVRDVSFTCNTRYVATAYSDRAYNMQYSVTPGWHATDLLPTFYNTNVNVEILGQDVAFPLIPIFGGFSAAYQSYLTSHARTGDPNSNRLRFNLPPTIRWPKADVSGEKVKNVLQAGNLGFNLIDDEQTLRQTCDFWLDTQAAAVALGGYAAPGAVVTSDIVDIPGDPSRNF
ncbi:MAG: hypothetical protein M1832_005975 [Thelocarpon impressellum]|nr:MAG: hypothetical protein M1832_005975 [Thelocarpon impressellum]